MLMIPHQVGILRLLIKFAFRPGTDGREEAREGVNASVEQLQHAEHDLADVKIDERHCHIAERHHHPKCHGSRSTFYGYTIYSY